MKLPHNPKEIIAIVDDKDVVIGKCLRKNHADGRLHRETSVLIFNKDNEILVQERADNGKLDYSASGHFPYNEDYLDGAVREVKEELGLDIPRVKFKKILKKRINYSKDYVNNRFVTLWEIQGDYKVEDIKIDLAEVKFVKYISILELKRMIKDEPEKMSEGFIELLQLYLKSEGI